MPLIDLKTDLKSLKYSGDRLGGGSSNQPYIQTDINTGKLSTSTSRGLGLLKPVETAANGVINTIGKLNKFVGNTDDGFIRGGALGAAQASTTDLLRIGKFFTDAPRGPLFIARQVGLQLSNPRLEVKKGIRGAVSNATNLDLQGAIASFTGGLLQPTRIYNLGINTLAQVPVNAFGGHFNRHGLLPVQNDDSKYLNVVTVNNQGNQDPDFPFTPNNRLAGLRKQFNLGDRKPNASNNLIKKLASLPFQLPFKIISSVINLNPLNILKGQDIIDSYLGGPKSVYGIGTTTIRRYDYTENKTLIKAAEDKAFDKASAAKIDWTTKKPGPLSENGPSLSYPGAKLSKNVENLNSIPDLNGFSPAAKIYQDQYKRKLERAVKAVQNIEQNMAFSNVVDPYYKAPDHGPFKNKTFTTIDTDQKLLRGKSAEIDGKKFKYYGKREPKTIDGSQITDNYTDVFARKDADIMTVAFRVVDPFDKIPPAVFSKELNNSPEAKKAKARRHYFSAYMNGYKDSFNGSWNEINYAGRAESFYVYNKFKRSVSFNLQIPCFNRKELFEKHRNLGQMAATTAGAYNSDGFLGGVLIQINLGNYLVGEFGILNNLSYSIPNDAAWDVTPEGRLAMYLEASFDFTIIHKDLPQYSVDGGFFKYLPNNLDGFLPTLTNPQEWVYDNYETYASGDTLVPTAVVRLNPTLDNVRGVNVTQGETTFNNGNVTQTTLPAFNPFSTTLSRSQQAKAEAAFLSDPLGINAAQQSQAQDPLGLNKYFNSIPQPPSPEETTGTYQYTYNPQDNNNNE
jgi:hypothetical protein